MSKIESNINQQEEYSEIYKSWDIPQLEKEVREAEIQEDENKLHVLYTLINEKKEKPQKSAEELSLEVQNRINEINEISDDFQL